jgi:hypothetical protein
MNESKELLEATVKGLREKIDQLNGDLTTKTKELADINKPVITGEMYDEIQSLVETGVDQVSIDEDNIEFSLDIDYDNKISLHDVSLSDSYAFAQAIMNEIDSHFKISTSEDIK